MSHTHRYPQRIGNWWLGDKLGSGFSGSIFRATNIYTRQEVALKIQHVDAECPTNRYERTFYPALQGGIGMPTLWAAGVEGKYDFLAIDLLGASLESLMRRSGKDVMDLRSVCCIAMQVITRLHFMHSRGLLHRDIQLGNCVIGLPPHEQTIYMIDFGFSKFYIDPQTKHHIPDSKHKRDFIGNYWFSSVGVHCRGRVPSRRDDLEAVALMLLHLLTPGGLTWTRNGVPMTDEAHERLKREKRDARPEDLCRGLPVEFEEFLRYCRRLKFADCPDYEQWVDRFRDLAVEKGYPNSSRFIWPPPEKPSVRVMQSPRRPGPVGSDAFDDMLNHLRVLAIGERQVLGARNEVANGVRQVAVADAQKPAGRPSDEVIVISDDDDENAPAAVRLPKAVHLAKLVRIVPEATDNVALARVVHEFVAVLQESRSRTLTKEGFAFLDALYKQLGDPSVYIQPLRTSRTRNSTQEEAAPEAEPRHVKMNKLFALRRDVRQADSNKILARMVVDFGTVINRSKGRTVTKDAFGFLEELAVRLRALA
ncbi:CK1/CK1 protein kinase [Amylocystis lapponica]|nr:CK1/CK1 protein kinase [Amylocystis lapponica]